MPKAKTILVNSPDYEAATNYTHAWWLRVKEYLESKGFTVAFAHQTQCTRDNFGDNITTFNPIGFTGVGHGSDTVFTGYNYEELIVKGQDNDIMDGRTAYFLSCNIGADLIPWLVSQGMTGAIGYKEEYIFMPDASLKYFEDFSNSIVYALADGKTLAEAYAKGLERCNWLIQNLDRIQYRQAIELIIHDRDVMVMFGDGNAKWTTGDGPAPPEELYDCPFGDIQQVNKNQLAKHMATVHYKVPTPCKDWWIQLGKIFGVCS